ncbi:MAG: hypothetical protein NZ523_10850 [Elioraea sp.]|nr:hypothetical protein [Elioraea sp.]
MSSDPGDPPRLEANRLLEQLARERRFVETAEKTLERVEREAETRDRSTVTMIVMVVFAVALLTSLVVLLVASYASQDWTNLSQNVLDVLKSVVLPVVTLVLGYYFGRGGRG